MGFHHVEHWGLVGYPFPRRQCVGCDDAIVWTLRAHTVQNQRPHGQFGRFDNRVRVLHGLPNKVGAEPKSWYFLSFLGDKQGFLPIRALDGNRTHIKWFRVTRSAIELRKLGFKYIILFIGLYANLSICFVSHLSKGGNRTKIKYVMLKIRKVNKIHRKEKQYAIACRYSPQRANATTNTYCKDDFERNATGQHQRICRCSGHHPNPCSNRTVHLQRIPHTGTVGMGCIRNTIPAPIRRWRDWLRNESFGDCPKHRKHPAVRLCAPPLTDFYRVCEESEGKSKWTP